MRSNSRQQSNTSQARHESNGIENNRGRARRQKKIAIQSLTLRLGFRRWHLAGARAQAKLLGDYTRTLPLNRLCLVEPFRLGLSLSLGTSRHPRPFDKRFIIKESSSPALIHASLDGVCLTGMGWAVKHAIPAATQAPCHIREYDEYGHMFHLVRRVLL